MKIFEIKSKYKMVWEMRENWKKLINLGNPKKMKENLEKTSRIFKKYINKQSTKIFPQLPKIYDIVFVIFKKKK